MNQKMQEKGGSRAVKGWVGVKRRDLFELCWAANLLAAAVIQKRR